MRNLTPAVPALASLLLLFIACGKDGATGPQGPPGSPGQTGAQGATGSSGMEGQHGVTGSPAPTALFGIQHDMWCSKAIAVSQVAHYRIAIFADGSSEAECGIADANTGTDSTEVWFYTAAQPAPPNAGDCITYFAKCPWMFTLTPAEVTCNSASSSFNGTIVSFGSSDCVVN